MRHKSHIRRLVMMFITFCVVMSMSWETMAATGTLTIEYAVDNEKTPVSGATFSASLVAIYDDSLQMYVKDSQYAGVNFDPNQLDTGRYKEIADSLYTIIKSIGNANLSTAVTDTSGKCSFTNMDKGLYLIWQSAKAGTSIRYETASPIIAFITESGNKIYPKTEKITTTTNTTEGTKTPTTPTTPTTPPKETEAELRPVQPMVLPPASGINRGANGQTGYLGVTLAPDGTPLGKGSILSSILPKTGEQAKNMAIGSMVIALMIITMWVLIAYKKKKGESYE